jgi:2-polyprenyl-3-methyl-5-hydroxy-6-metoxy-1,4-benzoquinol methylase
MTALRRLAAALFFRLGQIAQRAARVTDYLAIGTRQLSDMRTDSLRSWQAFYDSHPSHDSRLMPWESDFVERYVTPGAEILVIGCGSGRDLLPLIERTCRVTGIDAVRSSLDIARRMLAERGMTATLLEGFAEEMRIAGAFDVVIFSYYCYSVIPESLRRVAMLHQAAAVLNPGGHIVISVTSNTPRPHTWLVRAGRLSGALCRCDWRVEPGDLVWNNRENRPSYAYTHAFEPGEIEREAAAAGLTVVYRQTAEDNTIVTVLARL